MSKHPRLRPAVLELMDSGFFGTRNEIAERVFGHPVAVQRVLKVLHDEGLIRISRWRGGHAVWRKADGKPDAERRRKAPKTPASKPRKASRTVPKTADRRAIVREWFAQRARP